MALTIRPYQVEGLDFLADHRRGALFDEPGLGKTMQSLLAMRYLEPDGTILVVATGDATGVWQDETRFWLDEEPTTYAGVGAKPAALDNPGGIVITNYARVGAVLESGQWSGVIFDEAQMLRNRKTKTLYAAVRAVFDRPERQGGLARSAPAFFLSGTPIVKAAGDLWPILHLIDRHEWSSYWKFVQRHAVVWEDRNGWHVEGVQNTPRLWREISPYCLRRTVAEVAPDLPELSHQTVRLTMTPKQAKVYRDLEEDWIAEGDNGSILLAPTVLALETRLRQILVCPRLLGIDDDGASVKALVEVAANSSNPFVIFTAFPSVFPHLQAALARTGRPTHTVRGGMGAGFRESVDKFKADAKAGNRPILLCGLAMAKSWSVSEVAHECWILGADWNGVTMTQAERRLARHGQTERVISRYLVHEGTYDTQVLQIFRSKLRLADAILDRVRPKTVLSL